MKRALIAALVAAVAVCVTATAAFVDPAATTQPATADDVVRWLGLEAPSAGTCAAPASSHATGTDRALVVAAGGAGASSPGRTLDCAFVLAARDPLPEGVTAITVTAARLDDASNPVTGLALTAPDGSGPGASIELSPGERGAVRLTVLDRPASRGLLTLTVSFTGEQSGFLQYTVPVDVCADGLASSCTVSDPGPGDPIPQPPGGGTSVTPPVGGSAPSVSGSAPSTSKPKPKKTRTCTSRRTVNIRMKRSWKNVRNVRVTVAGKRVKVRRSGRRIRATIDLRNKPRTRVTVKITARSRTGRRLTDTRRYRTCTPKKPATKKSKAKSKPRRTAAKR